MAPEQGVYDISGPTFQTAPSPVVRLFHATSPEAWTRIQSEGFADRSRELHQGQFRSGVYLSDVRLPELAPVALLVSLSEEIVREFELLGGAQGYRRWLVPAAVMDRNTTCVEIRS